MSGRSIERRIKDFKEMTAELDVTAGYENALRDFQEVSKQFHEARQSTRDAIARIHANFAELHLISGKALEENNSLFIDLQRLSAKPLISDDERSEFDRRRQSLNQSLLSLRDDAEREREQNRCRIQELHDDFNRRKAQLLASQNDLYERIGENKRSFDTQRQLVKNEHDDCLVQMSEQFEVSLADVVSSRGHAVCESDLDELRSSWSESLRGLQDSIRDITEEIRTIKEKKKKLKISRNSNSRSSDIDKACSSTNVHVQPESDFPDEIADSDDDLVPESPKRASRTLDSASEEADHLPLSEKRKTIRRKLFVEQTLEEAPTSRITAAGDDRHIQAFLKALQAEIKKRCGSRTNKE